MAARESVKGINRLLKTIRACDVVAIDTMVFSYHLSDHPRYAPLATRILEQVEAGDVSAVTSTLTFAELLTKAIQERDAQAARQCELFFIQFPNLTLFPVDMSVARRVAVLRGETGLRMPDAIQIATAQQAGADVIVTNDYAWRPHVTEPALILLGDYV